MVKWQITDAPDSHLGYLFEANTEQYMVGGGVGGGCWLCGSINSNLDGCVTECALVPL
jgi:hypothetical protein